MCVLHDNYMFSGICEFLLASLLHCMLVAAQCIVICPVCGFVAVFVGLLPQ